MTSTPTTTSGVDRTSFGVGVLGAAIGSVCCALPAVAMALGLGGAAGLVALSRYQPYFVAASLLLVAGGSWYLTRRQEACCTDPARRRARYVVPAVAVGTYAVMYALVNYVVVPALYGAMPGM